MELPQASPSFPPGSTLVAMESAGLQTVFRARFNFRSRVQGTGESIKEYADALRILSVDCEYTAGVLDENIRDQLIFGLKSKATQEKLLDENDNGTLEKVMTIASAGEDFQLRRFGNQHPLSKEEIQDLVGLYLDEESLMSLRLVSKECRDFAGEELRKRQTRILQQTRWGTHDFSENIEFESMIGRHGLFFSTSSQILRFIETFGGQQDNGGFPITWPFFGEGIVCFKLDDKNVQVARNYDESDQEDQDEFDQDEMNQDEMDDEMDQEEDDDEVDYGDFFRIYIVFRESVLKFLEIFGSQVRVFIWRNERRSISPSLAQLQTMLSHTPNLRDLWLEGSFPKGHLPDVGPWPELPYLDSLHCFWEDRLRMDHVGVEPLLSVYGSELTALDLGAPLDLVLMKQDLVDDALLLPLSNVQDLTTIVEGRAYAHHLAECTDWKLKRLSLLIWEDIQLEDKNDDNFQDFDKCVTESEHLWSLIHQSCQSLEEVYIEHLQGWKLFVQMFLLPTSHNSSDNSMTCRKVKKLALPSNVLMRANQMPEVIRKKFPNVQHIQFMDWGASDLRGCYNYFVRKYRKFAGRLPKFSRDFFFKEVDYNLPMPLDQVAGKIFVHFWDGLSSLKKITVLDYREKLVYMQTRNKEQDN